MHLITPPFKLLFGTETHRLTKMVAFRLNGMAVPTNDAQFNALEKRLNGLIDDDGWVAVKAAAELHRTELTEYSRARPKVSQISSLVQQLTLTPAKPVASVRWTGVHLRELGL